MVNKYLLGLGLWLLTSELYIYSFLTQLSIFINYKYKSYFQQN